MFYSPTTTPTTDRGRQSNSQHVILETVRQLITADTSAPISIQPRVVRAATATHNEALTHNEATSSGDERIIQKRQQAPDLSSDFIPL